MVMSPVLLPTFTAAAGLSQGKQRDGQSREEGERQSRTIRQHSNTVSLKTHQDSNTRYSCRSIGQRRAAPTEDQRYRSRHQRNHAFTDRRKKNDRMRFAVSHVNPETLVFDSMQDVVHIDEKCIFDGKIGLWPFVEDYVAKRKSKNRQKGTLVIVDIEVDSDRLRDPSYQGEMASAGQTQYHLHSSRQRQTTRLP
uniref:AlNc14C109G6336 protein n=1 Tax=Albugo laibachii Nc14 TaxID=890382 RepID=F0WID5_9STRA|nr:AlNc14C109G6336 [Albugo laibachii Nc14]|eukprot:CCA21016.1 AlNc14C109G6336 [Albugo laibachii Nc14]